MRSPAGTATGVADHASDSLMARARKANPKATSTALRGLAAVDQTTLDEGRWQTA